MELPNVLTVFCGCRDFPQVLLSLSYILNERDLPRLVVKRCGVLAGFPAAARVGSVVPRVASAVHTCLGV